MQETLEISDFEIKEIKDFTIIAYKKKEGKKTAFVGVELFGKKAIILFPFNSPRAMMHNNLLFLVVKHQKIPQELVEMTNMVSGDYNHKEKKFEIVNMHGNNKEFFSQITSLFKKTKPALKPRSLAPKIKSQKIKKRVL